MSEILNALGERDEIGGQSRPRIVLPKSYYALTLSVEDVGVTDLSEFNEDTQEYKEYQRNSDGSVVTIGDEPVPAGGSPFVALNCSVADGPFGELDPPAWFRTRFWATPGKGPYIANVQKAVKAVTGQQFDQKAMAEAGFQFSDPSDKEMTQQEFRYQYLALTPQERLDLMVKLLRVSEWDMKVAVCRVGDESWEVKDDESPTGISTRTVNRILGWYHLKDKKFGIAQIQEKFYGEQRAAAVAMGLIEE